MLQPTERLDLSVSALRPLRLWSALEGISPVATQGFQISVRRNGKITTRECKKAMQNLERSNSLAKADHSFFRVQGVH